MLTTEAMHRFNHDACILWRRELGDAMPQIEHMAAAFAVTGENITDFFLDGFGCGKQDGGSRLPSA